MVHSKRKQLLVFSLLFIILSSATSTASPDENMSSATVPPLSSTQYTAKNSERTTSLLGNPAVLAIELPESAAVRAKRGPGRSGPTEIGVGRTLPEAYQGDLTGHLTWMLKGDGGYLAVVEIASPGAKGMRAGVRALATDGVVIRFFDPHNADALFPHYLPKTRSDRWKDVKEHWSPTVSGDRLGIEIHAANWEAATSLRLEIERISHVFLDLPRPQSSSQSTPNPQSGHDSCTSVPAACGRSSSCTVSATAKLSFVGSDGRSYVCTGTLINDDRDVSDKTNNALMHTANHCIDSQGVASSLELDFHYADAGCSDDRLDGRYARYFGGAELLGADPRIDQSLIRLRNPLPVGGLCLVGWDPNRRPVGAAVLGVHHPGGRRKEWAGGEIEGYSIVNVKGFGSVEGAQVKYYEGHTQGGSSGSGLFFDNGDDTHFLLGALSSGPESDCSVSNYGSFSDFYPSISAFLRDETPPPPPDDYGNTRSEAAPIAINTEVAGSLESPNDTDYFEFTVDGDGTVTIESTGSTDTIGTLYDADGRQLLQDDDGGSGYNFSLSMELTRGTYYLAVVGYEGEVGDYQISVSFSAAPVYSRAIPLLLSADEQGRQGFLRIQNYSEDVDVRLVITAIDDWGQRFGSVDIRLQPSNSIHFNSTDIEEGNANKGLPTGLGDGRGWWRLQLKSSTPIYATSYVRTSDGFLTSIHDTAIELEGTRFLVPIFNPASNYRQVSLLRVSNLSSEPGNFSIAGLDDAGKLGLENVQFSVGGLQTVHLTAEDLESGIPDIESGQFGNGKGKWQLLVAADEPARVASLMVTPEGHITNLSTINLSVPRAEDVSSEAMPKLKMLQNRLKSAALTHSERHPRLLPRDVGRRFGIGKANQ